MEIVIVDNGKSLNEAFKIRKEVFVIEQGVSLEDEFDEHDSTAEHILFLDQNVPVGTGRWRIIEGVAKLERICILPSHRGKGLGKAIVAGLEQRVKENELTKIKLHGQTRAEAFYQGLGYTTASQVFMEDGIPHVLMVKDLSPL